MVLHSDMLMTSLVDLNNKYYQRKWEFAQPLFMYGPVQEISCVIEGSVNLIYLIILE